MSLPDWASELLAAGGHFNSDGSVTLYHGTTPEAAEQIVREQALRMPPGVRNDEYGVYGSSSLEHVAGGEQASYGAGAVVAFEADPQDLHLDDLGPGWADFRIPTQRGVYRRGHIVSGGHMATAAAPRFKIGDRITYQGRKGTVMGLNDAAGTMSVRWDLDIVNEQEATAAAAPSADPFLEEGAEDVEDSEDHEDEEEAVHLGSGGHSVYLNPHHDAITVELHGRHWVFDRHSGHLIPNPSWTYPSSPLAGSDLADVRADLERVLADPTASTGRMEVETVLDNLPTAATDPLEAARERARLVDEEAARQTARLMGTTEPAEPEEDDEEHVIEHSRPGAGIPFTSRRRRDEPDYGFRVEPARHLDVEGQLEDADVWFAGHEEPETVDFLSNYRGSPGFVVDAVEARDSNCIRYELGGKHGRLVFSKGIVGALDPEQQAEFCTTGVEDREPTPAQRKRIETFQEAVASCKQEVAGEPKAEHLEGWMACMHAELMSKERLVKERQAQAKAARA